VSSIFQAEVCWTRQLDAGPFTFMAADALLLKVRERSRGVPVHPGRGANNDSHPSVEPGKHQSLHQTRGDSGLLAGALAAARGEWHFAAVLLGNRQQALRRLGQQRVDSSVMIHDRYLADLDQRLDAATLRACLNRGASLNHVELVDWLSSDRVPAMGPAVAGLGTWD
jgi:hypothetical protein